MYKVTSQDAGLKLAAFLQVKLNHLYSARRIKKALESNLCRVNGYIERFSSYVLREGDRVVFEDKEIEGLVSLFHAVDSKRILYEDATLLIYNKPSGISSDEKGLGALFPDYHLVHRLDRETTGVIILAKTRAIKQAMIALFRDQKVEKIYLAMVDGVPEQKSGLIESRLGRISIQEGNVRWGSVHSKRGLLAKTAWELQKTGKKGALLRCIPFTGRTHQIRVHLKEIGHPILGDSRYSKRFSCSYRAKRCLLHAYEIQFPHPESGKRLKIKCSVPKDIKDALLNC